MLDYLLSLASFAGITALMALGLDLIWGLGGMANLGLAGSAAVGAYTAALLGVKLGVAWPLAWAAAAVLAAGSGAVLAGLTARLRGDYLAIVTLGFAQVAQLVASNEIWLTGGTGGIPGVPAPWRGSLRGVAFDLAFASLTWALVIAAALLLTRLGNAPFGRVLRAIREDETVAAVAGKRVLRFKVRAFAAGSALVGLAGALGAALEGFVSPDNFAVLLTLTVVLALSAGGPGGVWGALLGGVLVTALTEGTRFAADALPVLSAVQAAALRQGMIALALILILHLRPAGILPERPRAIPKELR
jgi:branched-chain amino acid transport system permease protein